MKNKIQQSNKQGILWILIFQGDHPFQAQRLNLNKESDREYLEDLIKFTKNNNKGWGIAKFIDSEAYTKGCRLIGQHWNLIKEKSINGFRKVDSGIQIGTFQGLVQCLEYDNTPLSRGQKIAIFEEHKYSGYSVAKLSEDWRVSESQIRKIIREDKTPVYPSNESIKKGVSDLEPPGPCRVVAHTQGSPDDV